MSIEAMKQALEALALVASSDEWLGCQTYEGQIATSAYEALRQAIAEAEKQEPAFYVIQATDRFGEGYEQTYWEDPAGFPVYTAPPKSEWVGLMLGVRVDEDSVIIKTKNNDAARELCKELLKEKNG